MIDHLLNPMFRAMLMTPLKNVLSGQRPKSYQMRKSLIVSSIATALTFAAASQAALLTYDVRVATSGNSADVIRTDAKTVTVAAVGDVLSLQVYGLITSQNTGGTNGISQAGGALKSGNGGLQGNLGNSSIQSVFQGIGSSAGTAQNLDSDTDIDVGSNATNSNTDYLKYVSTAISGGLPAPVSGTELLLGTFTFTVTSLDSAGTTINFVPAALTSGTVTSRKYQNFFVDGFNYISDGTDSSLVGAGSAITVNTVPEPASLALAGLGGMSLLARRRRA